MRCSEPLSKQLVRLSLLEAGWCDGDGEAISTLTLMAAGQRARQHEAETGLTPFLYPTPEGGVSIEWDDPEPGQVRIKPIPPLLTADEAKMLREHLRGEDEDV